MLFFIAWDVTEIRSLPHGRCYILRHLEPVKAVIEFGIEPFVVKRDVQGNI